MATTRPAHHAPHDDVTGVQPAPAQTSSATPAATADGWGTLVKLGKLTFSMGLDLFDLMVGWILGFGIFVDLGCALISAALWGKNGWWALLEVMDVTEVLDMWCPTCTIIAVTSMHKDP